MDKSRLLKFSLNIDFFNKYPITEFSEYQNTFKNVEGTLSELADAINDGEAFSYQFHNEKRTSANFFCTDFIAIDIDAGWVISDALQDPLIKNYCSLLYTTPSHTVDKHRFRLVFILPRTIVDSRELKAATKALARRLGGDMAATDAARMFYGSANSTPKILGNELSEDVLNELITDGQLEAVSDSISNRSTISISKHTIEPHFEIATADGRILKFEDFTIKTSVYCPFHHDLNASAFVALNPKSIPYLVCSTCQFTRWLKGAYVNHFDFDGFENTVKQHLNSPPIKKEEFASPLTQLLYDNVPIDNKNIHFSYERYLKLDNIKNGITFIKSPKGTGKTNFLKEYLKSIIYKYGTGSLEEFENNTDDQIEESIYSNKKVLLIGHRQALISEMCKRLGLVSYLEIRTLKELEKTSNPNYGVCLDSLCTALGDQSKTKWDLIIIDESEQVLSHFLSETLGDKRSEIFNQLTILIRNAKSVIALDADLGWITFNTLTRMLDSQSLDLKSNQIYINKWLENKQPIFLYQTASQLIDHLKNSIADGKRVFVSSNSKSKIKALEKSIESLAQNLSASIPMITITAENSKTVVVQKFIKDIKHEIKKYRVILSSPSLGTGIDITFDDDAKEIDCVYGLYENRINTHFEIDQQLRRVRHPKEVHVWISPSCYNFETEFEVVKDEYLHNNYLVNLYNQQEMVVDASNNKNVAVGNFLTMAALITSYQRASKNKLKRNFINYKKAEGWQINEVLKDDISIDAGNIFFKTGKRLLEQEIITEILNAKPLEKIEYDDVLERLDSNDGEITRSEFFSLERTNIELFYRQKISTLLIETDNYGKLRRGISLFDRVTDKILIDTIQQAKASTSHLDPDRDVRERVLPNRSSGAILLYDLFSKTPIFKDGRFLSSQEFNGMDLKDFTDLVIKKKPFIENHLGLNVRNDAALKPVQQLGQFLSEVGLGHWKSSIKVTSGIKEYSYKLDADKLNFVMSTVHKRKNNENQWRFLNALHKFCEDGD